ncbi:MAG TPA: hypothetical protein VGE20_09885, partial [Ramlibacter sp.]
ASAGFRILRDWGVRAAASVAPPGSTGKRPALTEAPRPRRAEVTVTSPAAAATPQARPVLPLVQPSRGIPYDARAVLGGAASPRAMAGIGAAVSPPAVASVSPAPPDYATYPVPSRYEAVVGVPLEPYPPLPVPRLHRSDGSIASD